ncbi:uncharacterized protein PAC_04200 [Phialocephala subalpina]|uniref:Uncharacterized protein n=1 Tax=Phialocephala subalpina TaxID=576137 RepID=A0A1L7WNH9_9HELO|nr:uncharacterized protein PAC_04200 [Phialocephala subalpina]
MSSPPPSRKRPSVSFPTGFLNILKSLTSLINLNLFIEIKFPPTLTKTFDPSSSLCLARIFFPPNTSKATAPLPTIFSLHGGGFAIGHPKEDDEINTRLAANGILVIALSLGLTGFSASGNLALAVEQLEEAPKVKATVVFYPPVDFMQSQEERLARRIPSARAEKDFFAPVGNVFEWGYIQAGTPLDDHKLSSRYAKRSALSEWLFVVAPSNDMLCNEAGQMVANWLGEDWGEDWGEEGRIKWRRVKGQKHAFTHDIPPITALETVEARKERKRLDAEVWEAVGTWLMDGPFKK